jgi:hypothetical protein
MFLFLLVVVSAGTHVPTCSASQEALDAARQALKEADYDTSVSLLREALTQPTEDVELRRETYLLLINTYWQGSNYFMDRPQTHEASVLYRREAELLIRACLSEPGLRDTIPVGLQYPESLQQKFHDIRGEMFGALRVNVVDPPECVVILGVDTLTTGQSFGELLQVDNLPVGEHRLRVEADGRKSYEELVLIEPSSIVVRDIELRKQHGILWYSTIGVGVAAVGVITAVLVGNSGDSSDPVEPDLPGPPAPPSREHP